MSDVKVQAVVEASTEGVERAFNRVGDKAVQMASKVDQAAQKAGGSVDSIGKGAGGSADQLTRAEGRMVASIKRVQTQMELAGKTASQKFEFNIAAKGLDASKFEPMLAKMREMEVQQAKLAAGSTDLSARLGAMAVGAFAAVSVFKGVASSMIDAQQSAQKLRNSLEYAAGGATGAAAEISYLREVTNRLGMDFETSSQAYAKFAAATKGSGVTLSQTKTVFEGIAAASAKLGLSADETQGALLALSQMASKGTVSAEELRGQLGERLPGAFNIAAKSMGVTTAELGKMLQTGQVMASDFLPKFGQALKDNFQAPLESLTQELNRFSSAWTLWKQEMSDGANGGGFKWLTNGLNESTAAMRALGTEAGITQRILMAVGGFTFGSFGANKFDTAKVQEQSLQDLTELKAKISALKEEKNQASGSMLGARSRIDYQLNEALKEEVALREKLVGLAVRRGKESGIALPDLAGEYAAEKKKQADKLNAYINDVSNAPKSAKIAAEVEKENTAFKAAVSGLSETDSRYISALKAHNDRVAEIQKAAKTTGGGSAKNDSTQQYSAALAAEKAFAASQVQLIKARVAAGVESEEDGIKETLAAQISGYAKERELLTAQLAKTSDVGDKAKLGQQIAGISNGMQIAAAEYTAALVKIEQARAKYMNSQIEVADNSANKIEQENAALQEQIDVLGMSAEQLGEYESSKLQAAAAAEYLDAANLREAASTMEASGVVSDSIEYYRQLADAREAAGKALDQKAILESEKGMKKAAIDAASEWKKTSEKIGDSITDALMRGFESGKGIAENLKESLVNMFKTMVLKPTIQATVMGGLSAMGMGSAMASDGSSSGGMGNLLSMGNSAYSAYSGGGFSGLYSNFATSGVGSALGLSSVVPGFATASGGGIVGTSTLAGIEAASAGITGTTAGTTVMSGAGSAIGAAIPYIGLAIAAISLLAGKYGKGGTPHAGGIAISDASSTLTPSAITGILDAYGQDNTGNVANQFLETDWTKRFSTDIASALTPTSTAIAKMLDSTAATFGGTSGYKVGMAFSSDGETKSRGRYGILDSSGKEVFDWGRRKFDKDSSQGMQEFINATGEGVLSVLDSMDLPKWADGILESIGDAPNIDTMQTVVAQINAIAKAAEILAPALKMTKDNFASLYLLIGNDTLATYYNAVFTDAEKQAAQLKQVTEAFSELGFSLPESIAGFRSLVESQDSTTDAGRKTIASLMGLTSAFASVQSSSEAAAKATREAARALMLKMIDANLGSLNSYAAAANAAMSKAIEAEKTRVTAIRDAASESVDAIRSVFSLLEENVTSLYAAVDSTASSSADAGRAFIANALATAKTSGYLPDSNALSDAITAARSGLDSSQYTTQFEADKAALVLAGNLSQLKEISGKQLPVAERALNAAEAQLTSLDASLEMYQAQIDELMGLGDTALDISGSIDEMWHEIVAAINNQSGMITSAILQALSSGNIGSQDAADRLKQAGVKTDVVTQAGGQNVFVSSQGAVGTEQEITAKTGWKGTLAEAKASVAQAFATMSAQDFYALAISLGLSAAMIDTMFEYKPGTANDWARKNNLPQFAVGTNYVPHDMTAKIHEGEAIIPKAFNPAANGIGNEKLESLVESLTAEVKRLQSIVDSGNKHAARTANAVNGNPDQPILVEIA